MNSLSRLLAAASLALAGVAVPAFTAPVAAQTIDNTDPGRFVETLSKRGFAVLKGNKTAARGQFRGLLAQHFAVDAIGDSLIRQWRPKITPAQYQAFKAAFPDFIIGTYADRLYEYANATVKVVRVQSQGNGAAVMTQVTRPSGDSNPVIWSLTKVGNGYKVTNLTVSGVNLAMSQRADFDSYIQRNGFDALVKFMKARG